jgi:hypothetical protein
MRVPRLRFTVRRMMVAVATVALLLGVGIGHRRRAEHLKRVGFLHSVEANRWEMLLVGRNNGMDHALAEAILDRVHWHDARAASFERAAGSLWQLVEQAPPMPPKPVLPPKLAAGYTRGRFPWPPSE